MEADHLCTLQPVQQPRRPPTEWWVGFGQTSRPSKLLRRAQTRTVTAFVISLPPAGLRANRGEFPSVQIRCSIFDEVCDTIPPCLRCHCIPVTH